MKILTAGKQHAKDIASLIMTAMTDDCCLYFAGPGHTLQEFHELLHHLVEKDDSQYSYRNTLLATDDNGDIQGAIVAYDGARLHQLREAFVSAAKDRFGRNFSQMGDETQEGEVYIDSLAVFPEYRGKGVATSLLKALIAKAGREGHAAVGLLVDKGNPNAERLYKSVGFRYAGDNAWGGHPMKHLVYDICKNER